MPLGTQQLRLLKLLGGGLTLIVADKISRSLVRKGLAREGFPDSFVHITPNGLRALADAVEAGRVVMWNPPSRQKDQPHD